MQPFNENQREQRQRRAVFVRAYRNQKQAMRKHAKLVQELTEDGFIGARRLKYPWFYDATLARTSFPSSFLQNVR